MRFLVSDAVFLLSISRFGVALPQAGTASFGPNIEKYEVKRIPDANFAVPRNWAGLLPISGKPDDQLFFWLFETEDPAHSDDLIIWLNGGPGCSSMTGLAQELGPIHFPRKVTTPQANPYSWTKLANVLFVDQPVGTGFSVGNDIPKDNSEVTSDFIAYLRSFYAVFPGLKTKKTYLMSESWGGVYAPYIGDAILSATPPLPINLKGVAFGNPFFGNPSGMADVVFTSTLRDHNNTLKIPEPILNEFKAADKQCGFDDVLRQLTYPPKGKIIIPGNPEQGNIKAKRADSDSPNGADEPDCIRNPRTAEDVRKAIFQPCHGGCATYSIGQDYLRVKYPCFDVYNIDRGCADSLDKANYVQYLNRPDVKAAIHVSNKTFEVCNYTVLGQLIQPYPRPAAYEVIPRLLTQIPVYIYSGQRDVQLPTLGTELAIQNMTWNGQQGLSSRPNKEFKFNNYSIGKWVRERGLSFHKFIHAGHLVPYDDPRGAFAYVRDFIVSDKGFQN